MILLDVNVLVTAMPYRVRLREDEARSLEAWLRNGNTVLVRNGKEYKRIGLGEGKPEAKGVKLDGLFARVDPKAEYAEIFREVWQAGVVLAGVSAGSLCWHAGGTTVIDVSEVVTLRQELATVVTARNGRVVAEQLIISDGTDDEPEEPQNPATSS